MPTIMHSNKRLKRNALGLKTLSAAVISALVFANANAAGLGKLTVLSALGQPLNAEIELTSISKEEAGILTPKLASVEAFRQANIDFNPALFSLRFAVDQRAGRQFIRVTSVQPINEPFVDMLLELGGANGRLIREYTFLLDPAELRSTQSAQVAAPIVLPPAALARRNPDTAPAESVERAAQSAAKSVPVEKAAQAASVKPGQHVTPGQMATATKNAAASTEYKVKRGDSLSTIATQVKVEGVSLDQMLVALYRANPDAFVDDNMNRLRAGQILTVPDANTASGLSNSDAHHIVVAQALDFSNYRNKLAGQVATAAPKKATESRQSVTGKIAAKVEEPPTAANESKDKLKLSKAGAAANKATTINAGAEDQIAKDKAVAEANARSKELEKNVGELQKILEIKNKNLADQQKQADAAKAKPATPAELAASTSAVPMAETKPGEAKAPDAKVEDQHAVSASAPVASAPAIKPTPKVVAPPSPEPSFVDALLDSAFFLPGAGILLAALGGLGFYTVSRKRQHKQFEDSIITDSSLKANSLFGSTGGQSVDTNNSVFNSNFAPSANQLDTNEVDPVAEADVYIAYGRDAQAEEILKEALRTQPERNAVRVKLLEIYANRKDVRSFETLASELYGMTKGEGDDWIQATSLGVSIDPNNPLYAVGKNAEEPLKSPSTLTAPPQPLEEPDLKALLAATQSDTSLEPLNAIENSSYFGNDALATEVPLSTPDSMFTDLEREMEPVEEKKKANDLDFDLDGMGLESMEVPNTMPQPMPAESQTAIEEINFDFLEEKTAVAEQDTMVAVAEAEAEAEVLEQMAASAQMTAVGDFLAAHTGTPAMEIPRISVTNPASEESKSETFEFDLAGITLELNPGNAPAEAKSALIEEIYGVPETDDGDYSSNAEMTTKLDLAVAYQEIGDKEGARELLDEVVKGGTLEQAERAKSLLLKLA